MMWRLFSEETNLIFRCPRNRSVFDQGFLLTKKIRCETKRRHSRHLLCRDHKRIEMFRQESDYKVFLLRDFFDPHEKQINTIWRLEENVLVELKNLSHWKEKKPTNVELFTLNFSRFYATNSSGWARKSANISKNDRRSRINVGKVIFVKSIERWAWEIKWEIIVPSIWATENPKRRKNVRNDVFVFRLKINEQSSSGSGSYAAS